VERSHKRLRLYYQEAESKKTVHLTFDQVILALNPKQTSVIYPPTAYVMDRLRTSGVSVIIHQDYKMLPDASTKLAYDPKSELIALQVKDSHLVGKTTLLHMPIRAVF
jgi:hypothetical protein